MRRTFIFIIMLLFAAMPGVADDRPFADCSSGWRAVHKAILSGDGQAEIAVQCYPHEQPCPARAELVRRAKLVADAYALANLRAKVASEVSHEVKVVSGVGSDRLTMTAAGKAYNIIFCNEEVDGIMRTMVWAEVR